MYDLLFKTASETMLTIAADPRHLGTRIGITAVLHTWGSALTHHPHIHMIVPGGGFSLDGQRWVSSRSAFLLPVRVLAKLFRRLFLTRLCELHENGRLQFFGDQLALGDRRTFLRHLAPARKKRWVVYAKPPFAGPEAVLAYLSRYTHRVAIANRRLISLDDAGVTFRFKDYRRDGADRYGTMTLRVDEFIRRFLLHVLPKGFHRIRHYGLLASAGRKANLARARELLAMPTTEETTEPAEAPDPPPILSMLRRPHDDHRDLRARTATAGTAGHRRVDRDSDVVTRHDPPLPHGLARQPRRSFPRVFVRLHARLYLRIRSDRPTSNLQLLCRDRLTPPSDRFRAVASDTSRGCLRANWHEPFLKTP